VRGIEYDFFFSFLLLLLDGWSTENHKSVYGLTFFFFLISIKGLAGHSTKIVLPVASFCLYQYQQYFAYIKIHVNYTEYT